MRISDGSSDVCSSDLRRAGRPACRRARAIPLCSRGAMATHHARRASYHKGPNRVRSALARPAEGARKPPKSAARAPLGGRAASLRSEEHTSELQSLMRISYAVFCLKKKKNTEEHKQESTSK